MRTVFSIALSAILAFAVCLAAEEPVWVSKQPAQWTEAEARQILEKSPWSGSVTAGIARRLTEDQLREGGQMGQPHGVGNDGVDPEGSGPTVSMNVFTGPGGDDSSARSRPGSLPLRVVWESAMPIRLAELKARLIEPPTLEGDGYQIAVYGIPGASFKDDPQKLGEPLKQTAFLRRDGKRDVRPSRVEVFQRQSDLTAVYLFPLSAEISPRDLTVRFEARIGRISVSHAFELAEMRFQGKLAL